LSPCRCVAEFFNDGGQEEREGVERDQDTGVHKNKELRQIKIRIVVHILLIQRRKTYPCAIILESLEDEFRMDVGSKPGLITLQSLDNMSAFGFGEESCSCRILECRGL
jgi:hypothetical protein